MARAKAVMKATHLTTWNHLARENSGHLVTKSVAELFKQVLENAYLGHLSSESSLDPAERTSLLLLDKDLQHGEEGEILHPNSSQ